MGRGKSLIHFEMGQINAFRQSGRSNREISSLINRSVNVVNNYVKDPENYGKTKSPGRPSIVSRRDKRRIIKEANSNLANCLQIKANLQLEYSRRTINNVLEQSGHMKYEKMEVSPPFKPEHLKKRNEWTIEHLKMGGK